MAHRAKRTSLFVIFAILFALPVGVGLADNPASKTTTTAQELSAEVTLDPADDPVWLGTPVSASATANLGEGDVANIMYLVDVSTSMLSTPASLAGDCNGDAIPNRALDAACLGLIALNESLGDAENVNVGMVAYGNGAKTADMDPAAGQQWFTSPPDANNNGNSIPDIEEVIRSIRSGSSAGVGLFTNMLSNGFGNQTNYNAALTNMNSAFALQDPDADDVNIAFFMSDGQPNPPSSFATGLGTPLQDAIDAGTVVHTFGVGSIGQNSCNAGAPLRRIADQTGGTCTAVQEPGDLSTVLPATLTNIVSLELLVNGDVVASEAGSEPVSMSLANVDITDDLVVGTNTIEARATTEDDTVVTASTTLGVIDLSLEPAEETNELGSDNSHTVVATVSGDPSQVEGIPVDFEVSGQNAGAAGECDPADCTTNAAGAVSFSYSVPVDLASLGTDTIAATATIHDDQTASREVTKEWVDTTPPAASCTEGVNPSGRNVPRAGQNSPGQNEDGFYQLSADDDVWPSDDLEIFVVDTGSGTEFGPYDVDDVIKYTQAPGAQPNEKSGPGAVTARITGNGDAEIYAVDGSGNESERVSCLVPPPPQ